MELGAGLAPFSQGRRDAGGDPRDYLLDKGYCAARSDHLHPRRRHPSARPSTPPLPKLRYGVAKAAPPISGFVAAKYTPIGADKGYDLFVEVAKIAGSALGLDARFHVVGGFDPDLLDLGVAGPHFRFYGYRQREFFRQFYSLMDMIVAPTRPFIIKGGFDGFPTASCVEAGLQGVALLLSDPLNLNFFLSDGDDAIIVKPERDDIVAHILRLAQDPARLAAIGESGRIALTAAFSRDVQIEPRLAMLRKLPDA